MQYWILQGILKNKEFNGINSIVAESVPHLKRGAMRDFFDIINSLGMYNRDSHNKSDNIYTINQAQFEFFSADQEDKLRGARRNNLFMNEANNMSKHAFDELEVRTKHNVWIDFNPVSQFWGHDLKDVDFLKLTYKDNEMLDEQIVRSIESRKHNDQWWKVYGLGEIGSVEGVILTNWSPIDTVPEDAEYLCSGLDFGFTNDPTAVVNIYRYDSELIIDEVLYQKGMTNREIALAIKDKVQVVYADSAEPKSIAEIRNYGLRIIGADKGKDSVAYGIQMLQDYKLRPTKQSLNLIKALRNYSYQRTKDGSYINKPDHNFSDIIDAMRYGVIMRLKKGTSTYTIL